MPSLDKKNLHLAREHYDDVETAIRELGTLWILDLINKTLNHSKTARLRIAEKRDWRARSLQSQGSRRETQGELGPEK